MRTTQLGRLVITLTAVMELFSIYIVNANHDQLSSLGLSFLLGIPVVVLIMFYKLVIVITDDEIKLSFGIGLITKSFKTKDILEVKAVRNSILAGWGIRYTTGYTLYNIDGLDAIELTLKNKQQKIRIGTASPNEIIQYLTRR